MVAFAVWIVWALWASRPVGESCLNCDRELQRVDVVHCSKCLYSFMALSEIDALELDGVENLRAVADCSACGLPFDLADMHDCEVSNV
jgi:hypothetical protein